jgi:hypothetical protein
VSRGDVQCARSCSLCGAAAVEVLQQATALFYHGLRAVVVFAVQAHIDPTTAGARGWAVLVKVQALEALGGGRSERPGIVAMLARTVEEPDRAIAFTFLQRVEAARVWGSTGRRRRPAAAGSV